MKILLICVVVGFGGMLPATADHLAQDCDPAGESAPAYNTLEDVSGGQLRPLMTEHLSDPSGMIASDDIHTHAFSYTPCVDRYAIKRPDGALWLRFTLNNPNDHRVEWRIAFMETIFDEMALFEQTETGLDELARNGRTVPTDQRSIVSVRSALAVTLAANETKEFYVRVAGTFTPHATPLLVSEEFFYRWSTSFQTILIVLMGLIALLIMLSLILFRQVTTEFYKYYTLYLLASFMFIFILYGWFHRVFDVQFPVTFTVPAIQLAVGVGVITNIQYTRVLLSSGKRSRMQQRGFVILTVIAVALCGIAVLSPWQHAMPNVLMQFISPLILLAFACARLGRGLPQVLPLCGSLICLVIGLAIANYFFVFPPHITASDSVIEVMRWRAGTYSYTFAIIGEAMFMMLAISMMLQGIRSRSKIAFEEVETLRRSLEATQAKNAKIAEIAQARARFVEDALGDEAEERVLHFEDRLEVRARKIVLDNVGKEGFGPQALGAELGVSERTLSRRMNDALNISPARFIRETRLELARDLIVLRHYSSVAEVAYATGFSSVSHFTRLYGAKFNETPRETFKTTKRAKAAL
ncbi:helix-turn-helix domain-containing protein [Octadecabacter dasysiphoniae]|uniref:helix-turn-helix domain-containing protein n=1 Tax=Octadecabacter dasysiphoniae TaxID=2909341 RepID=UPI001F492346|nr:helix-turn-helix domain-containing protein [Octadecabacter dasysiphoniae]